MWANEIKIILIAADSGIPLVRVKLDENLDENMISGFLGAIARMGASSSEEQLTNISMECLNSRLESYFYFTSPTSYLIVFALLKHEIPSDEFSEFAGSLAKEFHEIFKEELESWSGDTSVFRSFEAIMEKTIMGYVKSVDFS